MESVWHRFDLPPGKHTLKLVVRGKPASVRWEFDPETEEVTALSNLAGDLGFIAGRKRKV